MEFCIHVQGSRTPSRLPAAVVAFLRERDIAFRELQPGLLEVVNRPVREAVRAVAEGAEHGHRFL